MPIFYEEDTHLITVLYWSVTINKKITSAANQDLKMKPKIFHIITLMIHRFRNFYYTCSGFRLTP